MFNFKKLHMGQFRFIYGIRMRDFFQVQAKICPCIKDSWLKFSYLEFNIFQVWKYWVLARFSHYIFLKTFKGYNCILWMHKHVKLPKSFFSIERVCAWMYNMLFGYLYARFLWLCLLIVRASFKYWWMFI